MISDDNLNDGKELHPKFLSEAAPPNGGESVNQDGPAEANCVAHSSQAGSGSGSTTQPPLELKISRAILSLAILLLLGSILCFLYSVFQGSILVAWGALARECSINFFCLSILSFTVWAVLWTVRLLWFKERRKSQK
jgi:hypothetical protein